MKASKILSLFLAGTLLIITACRKDDLSYEPIPLGPYETGIIIANEGSFSSPDASVSFLSSDLTQQQDDIFSRNNNSAVLGKVFQSIGMKGDKAYLVVNDPAKVEIVNRYTFQKSGSITTNLVQPRYIAFSANYTYISNNNFSTTRKVNIYDNADNFVKSIDFDRYADKLSYSDGFVYVQSDGVKYDAIYNELPTGHTISRINTTTNTMDKVVTLNDDAIIRDMASDNTSIYVLTSDSSKTYFYKINSRTGNINQQLTFSTIPDGKKLAVDKGIVYFITSGKKLYSMNGDQANFMFDVTASSIYGFNIIDSKVFVSDPSFTQNNSVRIYNLSGTLMKTITTGIATNGFYKN
ncbi:MAG: hypothetical protein BGO40_03375 [Chryseobacterium sp. 39-10]|nr:hypothetical protein [Chryseobacterium sp.]OJV48215.1 MAG: hypothetical protein BGO40_03375 [Chryseobacterium sp. 39-10]